MAVNIDKEKTRKSIIQVLDKIKTDADPQTLSEYRSIFKKEVSLFRRSWAAAYLLMNYTGQAGSPGKAGAPDRAGVQNKSGLFGGRGSPDKAGKNRKTQAGAQASARADTRPAGGKQPVQSAAENNSESRVRQYPLAEEDSRRIFVSIGRNRRVFPREILGLIIAKTGVSRDDIGAIRILENYSFVQVRATVAEQIIETLNGLVFRGRTLTVNFAKTRKDGEESAKDEAQDGAPFADDSEYPAEADDPDSAFPSENAFPAEDAYPSEKDISSEEEQD